MTPEELDEARAIEAQRRWATNEQTGSSSWVVAARLAREGWTPPDDPDVLAFGDWYVSQDGKPVLRDAYVAGARMAREQEQERAKVLVEPAEAIVNRAVKGTGSNGARWVHIVKAARRLEEGLTAYKTGKAEQ